MNLFSCSCEIKGFRANADFWTPVVYFYGINRIEIRWLSLNPQLQSNEFVCNMICERLHSTRIDPVCHNGDRLTCTQLIESYCSMASMLGTGKNIVQMRTSWRSIASIPQSIGLCTKCPYTDSTLLNVVHFHTNFKQFVSSLFSPPPFSSQPVQEYAPPKTQFKGESIFKSHFKGERALPAKSCRPAQRPHSSAGESMHMESTYRSSYRRPVSCPVMEVLGSDTSLSDPDSDVVPDKSRSRPASS